MEAGECQQFLEVTEAGDRALRICRRADIDHGGAGQKRVVQACKIRHEAVFGGGGDIDGVGTGGQRSGGIALIKRVRHQDCGPCRCFHGRGRDKGGVEECLAGAVDGQDLVVGVERLSGSDGVGHVIAPTKPAGDGGAEFRRADDRGVFAETLGVLDNGAGDEIGERVLRFAQGHDDGVHARLHPFDQRVEARERAVGQAVETGMHGVRRSQASAVLWVARRKSGQAWLNWRDSTDRA